MSNRQQVTFTLHPDYADSFDGGNVALRDGTSYDVKKALSAAGGTLTLDPAKDADKINALVGYEALIYEITSPSSAKPKQQDSKGGEA